MSTDDSIMSDGPSGEEAVGFHIADAMIPARRIEQFWESEPMSVWANKATEAIEALKGGTDVVVLTGRNSIGKTMQFGRLLEKAYPDMSFGYAATTIAKSLGWFVKASTAPLVVDEMTDATSAGFSRAVLEGLTGKRQLMLIFPGPTLDIRRGAAIQVINELHAVRPEATVCDLGDVASDSVDKDKALGLLADLGAPADFMESVATVPALLNPRLYGVLLEFYHYWRIGRPWDTAAIIRNFIEGSPDDISITIFKNTVQATDSFSQRHGPLISSSFSTAEAIQLYEFAGVPLPDRSTFDVEELGFDPYAKS